MEYASFSGHVASSTASSLRYTGPPTPPGQIKHAGGDTRPSKVTSHMGLKCSMVAANAQLLRVCLRQACHHGVNQLKFAPVFSLLLRTHCGAPRVLNSNWAGEDSTCKFIEIILIDPFHRLSEGNLDPQGITEPVHQHREMWAMTPAGHKSSSLEKGHKSTTLLVGPAA